MSDAGPSQPVLFGPAPRRRRPTAADPAPDSTGPVASVVVDLGLAHLDHTFSYVVPERLRATLRSGARVVVPFAGRRENGWVVDLADGPVAGLRSVLRVVTPLAALTPEVARLARAVADQLAGTAADVLRAAVPPRHAAAERALLADLAISTDLATSTDVPRAVAPGAPPARTGDVGAWGSLAGGAAFLRRTGAGEGPLAAVRLPLDVDPWQALAVAARVTREGDRDVVVVLPDVADVEAFVPVLRAVLARDQPDEPLERAELAEPDEIAVLHHGLGPAARWRAFLRVRLGVARVVVGTRSAVFAPVARPGLLLVWDDGDDAHVEPHSPGWDSAQVALLRARASGAGLALVSGARSVRTQWWVRAGRLKDVAPDRARRRQGGPRVVAPDPADPLEAHARLPRSAHRVAAEALAAGPVLVSVPRAGYAGALRCSRCRDPVRCTWCAGPLALSDAGTLHCTWCTRAGTGWSCPTCGATRVRAGVVGVTRSAEELGRAFPSVPVVTSRAGHRVQQVDAGSRIVVATPGVEPVAPGGYAAALVLDGDLSLARRGLGVEEETLRRWLAVAALVRPATAGGRLVVVADPRNRVVQALLQDAPELLADRWCDERAEAGLPPARTVARLLGTETDVADVAAGWRGDGLLGIGGPGSPDAGAPAGTAVLGPAPTDDDAVWQLLLAGGHDEVVGAVRALLTARSAAKAPGRLVVRVDPHDLD